MYTALGVTKTLPDGKVILKNINLCFYPGAKIGVLCLNERGKLALLKIMAGEDVGRLMTQLFLCQASLSDIYVRNLR